VTGPSLTSSTAIRAPNTPVSTGTPSPASSSQKRRQSGSASSGGAADVEHAAVEPPRLVLEDAQARDLAGEPLRRSRVVTGRDAEEDEQTARDLALDAPVDEHTGARDPLHDRPHRGSVELANARGVMLAAGPERARELVVAVRLGGATLLLE
jgi:hypothetical protein